MKRLVLFPVLVALVFTTSSAYAQAKYSLGFGNMAMKVDYLRFTDGDFDDINTQNAVYLGLEGYVAPFNPNLYIGMEVGWAGPNGEVEAYIPGMGYSDIEFDITYVPIELNTKYVFDLSPEFALGFGAGVSANYLNIEVDTGHFSEEESDWVFGGQIFAEINYKIGCWFLGLNTKYQFTADADDIDVNPSNFRAGGQVGFLF